MGKQKDTILYVDDENNNLLLFKYSLEKEYNVLVAQNTIVARQLLETENIKVVVSDLMMPKETGLEFIHSVQPKYPDISYIILTAFVDLDSTLEAINKGGIYRYMVKPWDINEMRINLNNAITAYDLRTENRKLLKELVKAEEHERTRIAVELHDGLGPILSTVKMYVEWLKRNYQNEDPHEVLELSFSTINEAIAQLRSISYNLSPHILEKFGLISTLQTHIENASKISKIEFSLNTNLTSRLPSDIEISLFRVLRECINNTQKHSGASKANILITQARNKLDVNYFDNGKGAIIDNSEQNAGMGLHNIRNRIRSLGGKFKVITAPGEGFLIAIEIPIEQK